MSRPLVAIGLDAAEPRVIEDWLDAGKLPHMARLRAAGSYRRLCNFDAYSAETPWTTFLTGVSPEKTGYWSPIGLIDGTYECRTIGAYDFSDFPPFYALGNNFRVAAFDVPQVPLNDEICGLQVSAWGAHSPQVPSGSMPENLFEEIVARFGEHPGLHNDYAEVLDLERTLAVKERLDIGAERRGEVCAELLSREPWDLFVTVFGEAHGGGHNLWHLSQPDHPLYRSFRDRCAGDPMLELFQTIDSAIGRMLESAADDANIVIFSAHGMGPNTMDLPSTSMLAEFLYRLSFPGHRSMPGNSMEAPLPPIMERCIKDSWIKQMWSDRPDPHPLGFLRRTLKRQVPWRHYKKIAPFIDHMDDFTPSNPYALKDASRDLVPFQPTRWMQRLWPRMKAFCLPSFAEGYVRVNLEGREPSGIVKPEEYDAFLDDLTAKIERLRDSRHGIPMARRIFRTRSGPEDRNPLAPDADLVVVWQEKFAADVIESTDVGRIGPLPHYRSGSHRSTGFMIAAGPDLPMISGAAPQGHALDLAPTMLSLMGAPLKEYFEGNPLLTK